MDTVKDAANYVSDKAQGKHTSIRTIRRISLFRIAN